VSKNEIPKTMQANHSFRKYNIIGHGSHAKGRTHTGGIGKGRKPKT
jgi:hypothetical protein